MWITHDPTYESREKPFDKFSRNTPFLIVLTFFKTFLFFETNQYVAHSQHFYLKQRSKYVSLLLI